MNDDELAIKLKAVAKKWNYFPEAALSLLDEALQQHAVMVTPNFGPYPKLAEEYLLPNRRFLGLPAWSEELIPANTKIEKYIFPDGRAVAKLVTDRGLVLALFIIDQALGRSQLFRQQIDNAIMLCIRNV